MDVYRHPERTTMVYVIVESGDREKKLDEILMGMKYLSNSSIEL